MCVRKTKQKHTFTNKHTIEWNLTDYGVYIVIYFMFVSINAYNTLVYSYTLIFIIMTENIIHNNNNHHLQKLLQIQCVFDYGENGMK